MEFILASRSPRRRELLAGLGLRFTVMTAAGEETPPAGLTPQETVMHIARAKAREVLSRAPAEAAVIAADTLVFLDGKPLGKPADRDEAAGMLRALSGREHTVVTGVAVLTEKTERVSAETTLVRFRPLSEERIAWYVATGEPLDKAGAYGIQGRGALLVEGITGDYFNVVGLPLGRLAAMLESLGLPWEEMVEETMA